MCRQTFCRWLKGNKWSEHINNFEHLSSRRVHPFGKCMCDGNNIRFSKFRWHDNNFFFSFPFIWKYVIRAWRGERPWDLLNTNHIGLCWFLSFFSFSFFKLDPYCQYSQMGVKDSEYTLEKRLDAHVLRGISTQWFVRWTHTHTQTRDTDKHSRNTLHFRW